MFGSKTPFGGTSTFQPTSFGATTAFGQNTSTFGANKPLSTGFGTPAFGSGPPNVSIFSGPSTTSGSIFGASNTSFGQPAASTSGFGFPSTSSTTTGLFGSNTQQNAGTNLFQSPSSSAFGAPKATFGGFGGTSNTTGLFGQPQQQQQQQQSNTLFGQNPTNTTGLFGSSGTSFPTAFGTAAAGGPNGTTIKFNPFTGTDTMMKNGVTTTINIRHQCITVMKEYESKSLEELRLDDYLANRKGPQQGTLGSFSTGQSTLFGNNPATGSTGLFQNQNKSIFGAPNAFGGGTTAPNTSTIFGQSNQQPAANPFGPKPITFGPATTASSTFSFPSSGGATSLFGTANTPNMHAFGPAATQSTGAGLFRTTTNTDAKTGFNAGFGNTFNQQNQQTGGIFGPKPVGFGGGSSFSFSNTAPGNSLFVSKPTPGLGTATSSFGTSPFGGNTSTGTSLFPQKAPITSFGSGANLGFGTNPSTFGTNTGLFSSNTSKTGGISLTSGGFGAGFGGSTGPGLSGTNLGMPSSNNVLGSDQSIAQLSQQQTQAQQQVLAMGHAPFADSPLFRSVLQDTGKREEILKPTNPAAQKALTSNNQYKISPHPTAKLKAKPLHVINNNKVSLFDGLDDDDTAESAEMFVPRRNPKKLVLKPKSAPQFTNMNSNTDSPVSISNDHSAAMTPPISNLTPMMPLSNKMEDLTGRSEPVGSATPSGDQASESTISKFYTKTVSKPIPEYPKRSSGDFDDTIAHLNTKNSKPVAENDDSEKENISRDVSTDGSFDNDSEPELLELENPHPAGIVLRRPGYFTIPSLEELKGYVDEDGNCQVENFTIGREGFGNVYFFGTTNIAGMNFDETVHFCKKEVNVYPDDETKPPLGEGLNKRARVTLDGVWPNDKTTCKAIKSPERLKSIQYQEKLERASAKLGAKFIDYRPETGSWVFQVKHFSKYGLEDSDEDDLPIVPMQPKQLQQPVRIEQHSLPQGFPSVATQQATPDQFKPHPVSEQPLVVNGLDHHAPQPFQGLDDDDEMEDITQQTFPGDYLDHEDSEESFEPPSHRLAMSLGVTSQRVQVMKASLFADAVDEHEMMDERDENMPPFSMAVRRTGHEVPVISATDRPLRSPDTGHIISPAAVLYPGSYSLNTRGIVPTIRSQQGTPALPPVDLSRYMLIPSVPAPLMRPHRTTTTGRLRTRVALEKSQLYKRQHLIADAACFMGRRFRVGWGPNWTVVHCGKALGEAPATDSVRTGRHPLTTLLDYPKTKPRLDTTPYSVTIERIEGGLIGGKEDDVKTANIESCLQTQLDNSLGTMEDGCPIFVPRPGVTNLHQQSELAKKLVESTSPNHPDAPFLVHWRQVWELCVALWGHIPGISHDSDEEESNYCKQKARRKAFSEWLQLCSKNLIQKEIDDNSLEGSGYLLSIFSRLTGCQVSEAASLAQQCGDHRLALLLAQAAGSKDVRGMVHQQLENWEEQKADRFVNPYRLKIFALLAGLLVWPSSTLPVNTCEGVDWKRTLALHLWYACSSSASIPDALQEYQKGFKGQSINETYCRSPLPPYLEKDPAAKSETDDSHPFVYDICYHLLKLYVKRSHRMDRVLCPTTWTPNHLDNRLSWILYQGLQAVGFDHLSDYQACNLHTNFAAQLESMNLWQWAIFVLLHIKDPSRRHSSVIGVLGKHVDLSRDSENEDFLHTQLLIPIEWIFEAKALKARSMGKFPDEAWYLLKAGQWNQSHEIILRHIAPDAIIKENYDYLKNYLLELDPPSRSASIIDWIIGGRVYLDYITISEKVEEIKKSLKKEGTTYELERLQPEVTSLCGRVGSIQCHSAKDRLSQSEMAKKTSFLLRTVLSLQNSGGEPVPSRLLTPHLARLPMPEDYALQELRALTQSYLLEMTS